ncbi:hypothetical protein KSP40_PGU003392 [Platanthera guangdongensis]|uniref:Uncharacterized protein n=1 Tax=Platanthera guangdongensis TaxID=2320717 RepID=A0ABR2MN29_9ASPA
MALPAPFFTSFSSRTPSVSFSSHSSSPLLFPFRRCRRLVLNPTKCKSPKSSSSSISASIPGTNDDSLKLTYLEVLFSPYLAPFHLHYPEQDERIRSPSGKQLVMGCERGDHLGGSNLGGKPGFHFDAAKKVLTNFRA